MRQWIKQQLTGKMGKDYSFDVRPYIWCHTTTIVLTHACIQELPLEYNSWLLFRQLVDIILLKWVACPLYAKSMLTRRQ